MADITPLRKKFRREVLEDDKDLKEAGEIYRVRFCGKNRREVEIAGRALGRALVREGFYIFLGEPEENEGGFYATLKIGREIITETGEGHPPSLLVVTDRELAGDLVLETCDEHTLLLAGGEPGKPAGFAGTFVPLPVSAQTPGESWSLGASCAGGAARLIGAVTWTAVEQALQEELVTCDPATVNRHLARALEAYDRTAPWAGKVRLTPEEVK